MKISDLNQNKDSSIFDLNIQRKINYNNSFNKTLLENNSNEFKTSKKPKFRKVSKFNPYDIGYLQLKNNDNINKTGIKNPDKKKYLSIIDAKSENKENDGKLSNIILHKSNKYLNVNQKYSQNLMMKFNTPKININLDNNKNTPEYLIKIKKQKNQYFTDLKKALNNMKVRSTNYSSNGSYNYTENNNYYYENNIINDNKQIKIKDSSFNKNIKKITIHKSNKQFFPKALKTLEKYLKIKSKLRKQNEAKKNKIRENKSANNLINKNKYIIIGNSRREKTNDKNNSLNKNEKIGISRATSFLNSALFCFCCCGDEVDN
jgi:hypothetical protein